MDRGSEWLTKREVSDRLKLSLRTVERRIEARLLRAVKDGRLVRIRIDWLLDYEQRREIDQ